MSEIQMHDGGVNSKERVAKYAEVFTPPWLVEKMLDLLNEANRDPEDTLDPFSPEVTFLDPACGEGQFPIGVLRRKFEKCKTRADYETAALSVWGIDIQADNVELCIKNVTAFCKRNFRVTKALEKEIAQHYILGDSLKIMPLLARYGEGHEIIFVREVARQEAGE